MKSWLRNKIKIWFDLYDIDDLQIGGHCGCCGMYIAIAIVPKVWSYSLCEECLNIEEIK